MTNDRKRNFGLDITRAMAIGFVVMSHAVGNIFGNTTGVYWYIAYLGVDLFFALSGFLIGGILIRYCSVQDHYLTPGSAWKFLVRRWFRTVPLYLIIMATVFFIERWIFHNPRSFDWKYLLWLQSWSGPRPGFFGISWSLCVEEWFYATFAAGLSLFSLIMKGPLKQKIFVFILIYIGSFAVIRSIYAPQDYTTYTSTIFRLDTIGYGVLMAYIYHYHQYVFRKFVYGWVLLGLILSLTGIYFLFSKIYMNFYYVCTGTGLAILVGVMAILFEHTRPHSFIVLLSKISYSMYLLNLNIILLILAFVKMSAFLQLGLSLLCIVLFSMVTYRFIEKPFLRFRDKHFPD